MTDGMVGQFTPTGRAGGTIRPFRLVKFESGTDNTLLEADANEACIGISQGSNKDFTSANHAEDTDPVMLQPGRIMRLECDGSGTAIAAGDRLKSDADGKGVKALTTGTVNQESPCRSLQDCASDGLLIDVMFDPQVVRPAIV